MNQWFDGVRRLRPPAEMFPLIRPLARLAGVTRLANITGLDRIGIPTFSAIRPNAYTLAVASGKGLTDDTARVSALMEAIEVYHAETAQPAQFSATFQELGAAACDPLQLPMLRYVVHAPHSRYVWTLGHDILDGKQIAVPCELVLLRQCSPGLGTFVSTSNGLAAGCVQPEATLVGLMELVERDAIACMQARARYLQSGLPRVRLDSARTMPSVQDVLARFTEAAIGVVAYDCTVDTHIPVFVAQIFDQMHRRSGIFYGSGADLNPEVALLRALTEAAQSRATYIAGARDDVTERQLAALRRQDSPSLIASLEAQPESVDLDERTSCASSSVDSDISTVLDRLCAVGVKHVVVCELTLPEFASTLSVIRVVAPGLAGVVTRTAGDSPRATAFATRAAA